MFIKSIVFPRSGSSTLNDPGAAERTVRTQLGLLSADDADDLVLKWQWAWMPNGLNDRLKASPWIRMFQNAREWCEKIKGRR